MVNRHLTSPAQPRRCRFRQHVAFSTYPSESRPFLRGILAYAAIGGLITAMQGRNSRVDPKQRGNCLVTSARKSAEFALSREADPGGCDASLCGRTNRTGRADL
jgi:hypothetical protein